MDSMKGDQISNKPETDMAQNTQNAPKLSASSSSSSSKSSEDNFFQLDAKPNTNTNSNQPDIKNDVTSVKIPEKPPLSPQGSINTPKTDNGYDPNRIPANIFNRSKSGTPVEWSVASNESLFSIKIGKSDELYSQLDYLPISPGSVSGSGRMETEPGANSGEVKEINGKRNTGKSVVFVLDEDETQEMTGKQRESTSGLSAGESVSSHQSFAFPILTGEGRSREALKNESETEEKKGQSQPLAPPSETQKEGTSDQQQRENNNNNNNNNNNVSWFSCFPWLQSCRWGNKSDA